MRALLIDADTLVYEACRAHEVEANWGGGIWSLHNTEGPVLAHFADRVYGLLDRLKADRAVMALSDYGDPWRKRVMPTYKNNRKDVRRPVLYQWLRDRITDEFDTYQRPGLEGDDVLGILLTGEKFFPGDEKIVCSLDKDMKTLPGKHYNLQRDSEFAREVEHADYAHLMQTLTGDTTDGYGGCPGMGPVGAEKLLAPFVVDEPGALVLDRAGAWQAIVKAYVKKGLSEAVALQNARVARICRATDYDYANKQVILWNPPQ